MTDTEFEKKALTWQVTAYGCVIRGHADTTSEDQIAKGCSPVIAERMAACWNACRGISTYDLETGELTCATELELMDRGTEPRL